MVAVVLPVADNCGRCFNDAFAAVVAVVVAADVTLVVVVVVVAVVVVVVTGRILKLMIV